MIRWHMHHGFDRRRAAGRIDVNMHATLERVDQGAGPPYEELLEGKGAGGARRTGNSKSGRLKRFRWLRMLTRAGKSLLGSGHF